MASRAPAQRPNNEVVATGPRATTNHGTVTHQANQPPYMSEYPPVSSTNAIPLGKMAFLSLQTYDYLHMFVRSIGPKKEDRSGDQIKDRTGPDRFRSVALTPDHTTASSYHHTIRTSYCHNIMLSYYHTITLTCYHTIRRSY